MTFSSAVSEGRSWNDWKTKPTLRPRNSARASTAKQAQSRAKMLARMQPIAELANDPSLSFGFPDPDKLRPPLITLDMAAVGYDEVPILKRLNLRLDPDDRIALLGRKRRQYG